MSPPQVSSIVTRRPSAHREVAHQLRLREAADLRDLEVERLHRLRLVRAQQRRATSVMHSSSTIGSVVRWRTIRHSSSVGHGCSKKTRSRSSMRARDDDGVLQPPAAVRVGDDDVPGAGRLDDAARARGVLVRVGADLELEAVDALGAARRDVRRHLLAPRRAAPRSRAGTVRQAAAEQLADGQRRRACRARPSRPCRSRSSRRRGPSARGPSRRATAPRFAGVEPEHRGRELRAAPRGRPRRAHGRYAGPSGQTSPKPSTPSVVVTRTTVEGSVSITRPPDIM